ncbi:hypothetical protein V475_01430 [Sphingobium baderi LL03]|uniref:Tetratricopeptide repeat protein n=2 Tax=Sphingobium baderi TaxID=1332080 RepID=T0HJC2_9SPHN|nr:hypothetical protein [Sphingobium baderi]EQA97678.1 hypothetical protein L485_20695 [Sphingobium baderi LL03]KMS63633.1 hypothetical protein V475_01430 [Sphingobium baderi LL03]
MRKNSKLGYMLAAAMGVAVLAAPAMAKKKPGGPAIQMSDDFRANVQAAQAALKTGDTATASARIAALNPATDFEAYAAAGLRFELAVKRQNIQAERLALTDMFKTNSVPKKDAPRLRYVAGYLSYTVGNYDDAVAQLDYARTLGYDNIDASLLRADIYLRKNKPKEAWPFVQDAMARKRAAGEKIPAPWFDRAISLAYQAGSWADMGALYRERLSLYRTTRDWRSALSNYLPAAALDPQIQLDLYRLQAASGAMASERDYQSYAQLADKTGYHAETKTIIEAGRSAGKLMPAQAATAQLLKAATPKATKEMAALPAAAKKAASEQNGTQALAAADTYFSLAQYPKAAELYRLALTKGGINDNQANARLGISLARSGDLVGGKAALANVKGNWGDVAGFWSIWIEEQSQKTAQGAPSMPHTNS